MDGPHLPPVDIRDEERNYTFIFGFGVGWTLGGALIAAPIIRGLGIAATIAALALMAALERDTRPTDPRRRRRNVRRP